MKTILRQTITIILTLLSVNIYSQNHVPQAGDTIPNPNLEKFAGTWRWEGNGKSFTLILKKMGGVFPININMSGDMLIGYHEYKNNGIIIESSLPYINDQLSNGSYSAFAAFKSSTPTPNELIIGITHISKRKSIEAKIEYLNSTHIKIVSFSNYQGIKVNTPTYTYDPSISLPYNIILTKQ